MNGSDRAIEAARGLLDKYRVRAPDDIHVERLACMERAFVAWGETGSADARVTRGGDRAYVRVSERLRGTPRGRFSIAHELGHWLLHGGAEADALERIHGEGVRRHRLEREADAFGVELLMPHELFAPLCARARRRITLDDVADVAARFGTSITATGRRYAQLGEGAYALVECAAGRVVRATRSRAFRGVAVARRAIEERTAAMAVTRDPGLGECVRVARDGTWGSSARVADGGGEMIEHAVVVRETGNVIVWLWHGA